MCRKRLFRCGNDIFIFLYVMRKRVEKNTKRMGKLIFPFLLLELHGYPGGPQRVKFGTGIFKNILFIHTITEPVW